MTHEVSARRLFEGDRLTVTVTLSARSPIAQLELVSGHLFYTELLHLASSSWLSIILDLALPRNRAIRSASEYLERLLTSNSARIQNDLIERVAESRQAIEADIRARLTGAREAAERALEGARARNAEGREAVRAEIERLTALRQQAAVLAPAARESRAPAA